MILEKVDENARKWIDFEFLNELESSPGTVPDEEGQPAEDEGAHDDAERARRFVLAFQFHQVAVLGRRRVDVAGVDQQQGAPVAAADPFAAVVAVVAQAPTWPQVLVLKRKKNKKQNQSETQVKWEKSEVPASSTHPISIQR